MAKKKSFRSCPDSVAELELEALPGFSDEVPIRMSGPVVPESSDEEFASQVAAVIQNEICAGEGSNFLISRKHGVKLESFDGAVAHTIFRRLARSEFGAYLTFCFFDGKRYFIGSSPERHMTIRDGLVQMNPISRHLAQEGAQVARGPHCVSHRPQGDKRAFPGRRRRAEDDVQDLLRRRRNPRPVPQRDEQSHSHGVRARRSLEDPDRRGIPPLDVRGDHDWKPAGERRAHHPQVRGGSRRYYTGAIVLRSCDADGKESLDSAITIRTMEVDLVGQRHDSGRGQHRARLGSREGVPRGQGQGRRPAPRDRLRGDARSRELHRYVDEQVEEMLRSRNKYLSRFWINDQQSRFTAARSPRSLLIIDNEDEFTFMLRHMLDHLGIRASIRNFDDPGDGPPAADLVLVGPGPGDPTDASDPKMAAVHGIVDGLLGTGRKFLAVCLGHQILCHRLGMSVVRVDPPLQGVQQSIDLFGRSEALRVLQYVLRHARRPRRGLGLEIAVEPGGRISALRSAQFVSFQFHVESVLTTNGMNILRDALDWLSR